MLEIKSAGLRGVILAISLLTSSCNQGDGLDEGFGSMCVNSTGGACVIPYAALFSGRDVFVGRNVSFVAYLAGDGGEYFLYFSAEQAKYGARESAISLSEGYDSYAKDLAELNGKYVSVSGVIRGSDRWWLGMVLDARPVQAATVIYPFDEG